MSESTQQQNTEQQPASAAPRAPRPRIWFPGARYIPPGPLKLARFENGRAALIVGSNYSPPDNIARLSVNLPHEELAADELALKDYSENEGTLRALLSIGAVAEPHRLLQSGHVAFPVCRLLLPVAEFTREGQQKPDDVRAWIRAASLDGWNTNQLYRDMPLEDGAELTRAVSPELVALWPALAWEASPLVDAARYFVAQARFEKARQGRAESATLYTWSHSGKLGFTPPVPYSFDGLLRAMRECSVCNAEDVDVERVGFASRMCHPCAEHMRPIIERPGWCE